MAVLPGNVELGAGVTIVGSVVLVCEEVKVAVTVVAWLSSMAQVPVPLQPPPLQPSKEDPEAASADKVRSVPVSKFVVQVPPQEIPLGALVMVPWPVPVFSIVSGTVVGIVPPVEYWKSRDCQLEAN